MTRDSATPFQREAIAVLGRTPEQQSDLLVGPSLRAFAGNRKTRAAAANELKKRPLPTTCPRLALAGLANPIEFEWSTSFDPTVGLLTYDAKATQEGRDTIRAVEYESSTAGSCPASPAPRSFAISTLLIDLAKVAPALQKNISPATASKFARHQDLPSSFNKPYPGDFRRKNAQVSAAGRMPRHRRRLNGLRNPSVDPINRSGCSISESTT